MQFQGVAASPPTDQLVSEGIESVAVPPVAADVVETTDSKSDELVKEIPLLPAALSSPTPSGTALDRWVLAMGIPDLQRLGSLGVEMENAFLDAAMASSDLRTVKGMSAFLVQLSNVQTKVGSWLSELPNRDQLLQEFAAAETVYQSAKAMLPEMIEAVLDMRSQNVSD